MSTIRILVLCLALLAAGCGGEAGDVTEAAAPVTIAQFNAASADYVDKVVEVSGTVDHVCTHGGKRLHIIGDDPGDRLKVETGGQIAAFDAALIGSDIKVRGIGRVLKIDDAYLDNLETKARADAAEGDDHDDHAEGAQPGNPLNHIEGMREQLAASGDDALRFYHIECLSYEVLK